MFDEYESFSFATTRAERRNNARRDSSNLRRKPSEDKPKPIGVFGRRDFAVESVKARPNATREFCGNLSLGKVSFHKFHVPESLDELRCTTGHLGPVNLETLKRFLHVYKSTACTGMTIVVAVSRVNSKTSRIEAIGVLSSLSRQNDHRCLILRSFRGASEVSIIGAFNRATFKTL